jgi:peptide methionine sulfoxide reductase msrA/msrB
VQFSFVRREKSFKQISGVISVTSGYAGGNYNDPTYHQVLANKDDSKTFNFLNILKKVPWNEEEEKEEGNNNKKETKNIINHAEVVKVLYDTKLVPILDTLLILNELQKKS